VHNLLGYSERNYINTVNGQTHIRTAGDRRDPAVLILHQSPLSSAIYEPLLQHLAHLGWFVVAPDLPGFGLSDRPLNQWGIPNFAHWAEEVCTELSLDSISVIGQHTGATIGVEMFVSNPDRVVSLILQGLPLYSDQERKEKISTYAPGYFRDEQGSHLLTIWNRIYGLYPGISIGCATRQVQEYLSIGPDYGLAYRAVFAYRLPVEMLQGAPLSFLHGDNDLVERMRQDITAAFPNAAYETIRGGSDFVSIEKPEEFAHSANLALRALIAKKGVIDE
jgi:pimeloyl-ACP methyl ester carboxylesterase